MFVDKGVLVNSGPYDGMDFDAAFKAIADYFEDTGRGNRQVNYRLRDWGVSPPALLGYADSDRLL